MKPLLGATSGKVTPQLELQASKEVILLPAQWQSPPNRAMGAWWGAAMFHLLTLPR